MIICEIGLNHMGDEKYAKEYVKKIIDAKADGILFHIREKSFYEKEPKLQLSDKFYREIKKIAEKNSIKFGITLADPEKLEFCEKINVDFYKIFSRDILEKELVKKVISTKKQVFVSTGISNLSQIKKFEKIIKNKKKQITLIHTFLDKDISKVNLNAIPYMKEKFKMNIAYGNHAENVFVTYLALAFQPSDILFYVKGSKYKKHVDDVHAVKMKELENFIKNLRVLPKALGNKTKRKIDYKS